jgi:cytochrome b561
MTERYGRIARTLHWTIAALVIANIVIGILHDALRPVFPAAMPVHKAIGLTILALTLVRIAWRLTHRSPTFPRALLTWEKGAAHAMHFVFYLLLLALPLTGWAMSSASERPLTWFGMFDVPRFAVTKGDAMYDIAHGAHGTLGLVFGALALIHIAAALRHHFLLRDGVLRRMWG